MESEMTQKFSFYGFGWPPEGLCGRIAAQQTNNFPADAIHDYFTAHSPNIVVLAAWDSVGQILTLQDHTCRLDCRVHPSDTLIYTPIRPAKGGGGIDLSLGSEGSNQDTLIYYVEPFCSEAEAWMHQHFLALRDMTGLATYVHPGYSDC
jgi:hypothetical protein